MHIAAYLNDLESHLVACPPTSLPRAKRCMSDKCRDQVRALMKYPCWMVLFDAASVSKVSRMTAWGVVDEWVRAWKMDHWATPGELFRATCTASSPVEADLWLLATLAAVHHEDRVWDHAMRLVDGELMMRSQCTHHSIVTAVLAFMGYVGAHTSMLKILDGACAARRFQAARGADSHRPASRAIQAGVDGAIWSAARVTMLRGDLSWFEAMLDLPSVASALVPRGTADSPEGGVNIGHVSTAILCSVAELGAPTFSWAEALIYMQMNEAEAATNATRDHVWVSWVLHLACMRGFSDDLLRHLLPWMWTMSESVTAGLSVEVVVARMEAAVCAEREAICAASRGSATADTIAAVAQCLLNRECSDDVSVLSGLSV